jgi:hypothetical protein
MVKKPHWDVPGDELSPPALVDEERSGRRPRRTGSLRDAVPRRDQQLKRCRGGTRDRCGAGAAPAIEANALPRAVFAVYACQRPTDPLIAG